MSILGLSSLGVLAFIVVVWGVLALVPGFGMLHGMARVSLYAIPAAIISAPAMTLWPLALAVGLALYRHNWSLLLPGVAGVAVMLALLVVNAWRTVGR